MVARRAKIAVTVDAQVLKRVEQLRSRTGESRSALVNRALSTLTQSDEHERRVAEYVEAYRRVPQTREEADAAHHVSVSMLARLPWDDE